MSEEILINGKKITELSDMFFEYCELKKENEDLKEKNKGLLNLCNNGGALLVTESAKTKKYKQALEEIREIAKYSIMHNSNLNSNYQIILQNIDEILNDRN